MIKNILKSVGICVAMSLLMIPLVILGFMIVVWDFSLLELVNVGVIIRVGVLLGLVYSPLFFYEVYHSKEETKDD
jgi:hypothetical protein